MENAENMTVPVPDRPETEEIQLEPGEITADDVNNEILATNEDGYCPVSYTHLRAHET